MNPRSRWGDGRSPLPRSRSHRRSPSSALINRSHLNVIVYTNLKSFPCSFFSALPFYSLRSRACRTSVVRERDASSLLRVFSSFVLPLHLPWSLPRAIAPVNDADDETLDVHPPPRHLTQVPACKSSPCAFAPYAARYASSASLCRRNGDIETGAPCRTPTSDGFSGYSSACRPCRRPGSWNPRD